MFYSCNRIKYTAFDLCHYILIIRILYTLVVVGRLRPLRGEAI